MFTVSNLGGSGILTMARNTVESNIGSSVSTGSMMEVTTLGSPHPSIHTCGNYIGGSPCMVMDSAYNCSIGSVLNGSVVEDCTSMTHSYSTTVTITELPTTTEVDYSNDTTTRTCPATTMVLYRTLNGTRTPIGSNTIDDTDVREGRLVVNISLTSTADYTFRAAMPATLGFTVESSGVQDPRSFPAVVNTAGVECAYSPANTREFIVCTFPTSPDYTLRAAETLVVTGSGARVSPPCTDATWRMGSIRVEPAKGDIAHQIFTIAVTVVASIATVVVLLFADGTPIEIQVMIVLLNGVCASNVDVASVDLVRYFLSPAIHLGWWWVIVCNVCMAAVFAILHTCIVAAVTVYRIYQAKQTATKRRVPKQQRLEISRETASTVLYPGLPLVVCHVLYMGVACGTFDVLRTRSGADAAVSALGLVYLVVVPIIDVYLLREVVTAAYIPYDVLGCVPKTGSLSWMYPRGVWGPTGEVRRYFGLIGPYRDGYRYGALLPLCLALLTAFALHALPGTVDCDYLFVACAVGGVLAGVGMAVVRPHRATAQSLLTAACLMCVGLLAVMQIVAIRANSEPVESAKTAMNYLVVILVIVRTAHGTYVHYIEWRWAREVDAAAAGGLATPDNIKNTHVGSTNFRTILDLYAKQEIDEGSVRYSSYTPTDDEGVGISSPAVRSTTSTMSIGMRSNRSLRSNHSSVRSVGSHGQRLSHGIPSHWDSLVPVGGEMGATSEKDDSVGVGTTPHGGEITSLQGGLHFNLEVGNTPPTLSRAASYFVDGRPITPGISRCVSRVESPRAGTEAKSPKDESTSQSHSLGVKGVYSDDEDRLTPQVEGL